VACGDLDGDSANDLVLVNRTTVAWGHVEGGKFVATESAPWNALAQRSSVPLREPLGTAAIVPRLDDTGADLFVGTTERGGVALSRDLRGSARLLGLPVLVEGTVRCVTPNPRTSAWEGHFIDCATGAQSSGAQSSADATRVEPPLYRYDALAVSELVGRDGVTSALVAARDPGGSLRLRVGDRTGTLESVGAQIALGDLDEDGIPEVVTTADEGEDAITIWSWRGQELVPRLKIPAPASVRTLAVCPADDSGLRRLIAIVAGEVWVVR
jgi:hypothetical protein